MLGRAQHIPGGEIAMRSKTSYQPMEEQRSYQPVTTEIHFSTPPAHTALYKTPSLGQVNGSSNSNTNMCCSSINVPGVTEDGWNFMPKEIQKHIDSVKHRNRCQRGKGGAEPSPVLTQGVPLNSLHFKNTGSPYCQIKKPQCPSWHREAPNNQLFPNDTTDEGSKIATGHHWQADIIPVEPGGSVLKK